MNKETARIVDTVFEMKARRCVSALEQHGFTALYCATAAEAATRVVEISEGAKTVGFGGSMSVAELGVEQTLAGRGVEILNHGAPDVTPGEKLAVMRREQTCDVFVCGVNAVTTSGEIVNIDGVGNRVAASIFGPEKIILVAGRNKIVDGDSADAIWRVKAFASPPNCVRLDKRTPCAKTGCCADCDSPDRICRVTVIMDRKPSRSDVTVLVVNEDLGY